MKILAFSDFHGLFGLKNHFTDVKLKLSEIQPDILIFCGDFRNHLSIRQLTSRMKLLQHNQIYYVWGNDDELDPEFNLKIGTNLHLKTEEIAKSLLLIGIGGDELDVKWRIQELERLLKKISPKKVILISHIPPFGILDYANDGRHVGSKPYRRIIDNYKPLLCLFGHIHEQEQRSIRIKETVFWNIGPKGIVINL
ncbi:MAG: metallophosphoesterase family protein [Candidatus Helarchaeota archaeon]